MNVVEILDDVLCNYFETNEYVIQFIDGEHVVEFDDEILNTVIEEQMEDINTELGEHKLMLSNLIDNAYGLYYKYK